MSGSRPSHGGKAAALDAEEGPDGPLIHSGEPAFHASKVPPGWSVYANPDHSTNSSRLTFVSPSGIKMRSIKDVERVIQETASSPRIPMKGAVIEAEMEDPHENRLEWVQGIITKVLPKNAGFKVSFKVENADERGVWEEKYQLSEEGTEWRWPQLSIDEFKQSAQEAVEACRQAMSQAGHGHKSKAGIPVKREPEDEDIFVNRKKSSKSRAAPGRNKEESSPAKTKAMSSSMDTYKILGIEVTAQQMADAAASLDMIIDENTSRDHFKRMGLLMGVTTSSTGMVQSRISYAVRRTFLRNFSAGMHSKDVNGGGKTKQSGGSVVVKHVEHSKGAHSVPANLDDFHARVQVGAMIEAEMDDTMGGTEWVAGQVQSVNAARATFSVRFKVESETETGEWNDEYQWEELGREWRFAGDAGKGGRQKSPGNGAKAGKGASQSKKTVDAVPIGSKVSKGALSSHELKGMRGAEIVADLSGAKSRKSIGTEDVGSAAGAIDDLDDVACKLRHGVAIEAEMDDSHGGTEWIPGVVQSVNQKSKVFTVKFNVKNEDESGEWEDEYRFDEVGKEWRFPASKAKGSIRWAGSFAGSQSAPDGHWEKDLQGNRAWVTSSPKAPVATSPITESSEYQLRGKTIKLANLKKFVALRGGFDEVSIGKQWSAVARELGFETSVHTDISTMMKKLYREIFIDQRKPAAQKSPNTHSFHNAELSASNSSGMKMSGERTILQEEDSTLLRLGIKTGVAVDVRIEWPPGQGKKKWIPTTVRRVHKKKNFFRTELDAEGNEEGRGMRFFADAVDKVWRLSMTAKGAAKGTAVKQEASDAMQEDTSSTEPYVGARIEVLFDVDGTQEWYGGKILRKDKKAGCWQVLYDDGDEDTIKYPDPKGEVRVVSSKKKRGAAKVNKGGKDTKASQASRLIRLRAGDLCRVLFEDGVKYLGVVTEKDPEIGEFVILFEDGEEHRVVLPDPDVFEATRDEALVEWEETHGESKTIPWWCAHCIAHPVEDGEFDVDVPENWSRVLIRPPVKPKRSSSKSRKKSKEAASSDPAECAKPEAGGDYEMPDRAEGADAGKDAAKSRDGKAKKKDAMDIDGQAEPKRQRDRSKETRKPRDRDKEKLNRREREILSKSQTQYLYELEALLLQETPEEILEDDDNTDFIDAMSIFLPQTDALNNKDFCLVCGSSPNKEEVIYCRDCGDCFHTYCAIDARTRKIPKEKRHLWRCPACRICEECGGEENWENMLCCDGCDRGFHTYCLKPPMKQVPNEGWKCNDCVHCVSCGAKHFGIRKDIWRKDCTLCISCFQLYEKKAYCPICKVVWQKEQKDARAVMCDTCNMWVHPQCAGIDDAKYQSMQDEEEQTEWNCPRCNGDLEESDEEEIDKKYVLPTQTRIIEAHRQFEEFCHDRLKILLRTCDAIERAYQHPHEDAHLSSSAECLATVIVDTNDPWSEQLEALKTFAIMHGHVHVRQDNEHLGVFVQELRGLHKQGKLSKSRLEFLEHLGFCFDDDQASQLRSKFEEQHIAANFEAKARPMEHSPQSARAEGAQAAAVKCSSQSGHDISSPSGQEDHMRTANAGDAADAVGNGDSQIDMHVLAKDHETFVKREDDEMTVQMKASSEHVAMVHHDDTISAQAEEIAQSAELNQEERGPMGKILSKECSSTAAAFAQGVTTTNSVDDSEMDIDSKKVVETSNTQLAEDLFTGSGKRSEEKVVGEQETMAPQMQNDADVAMSEPIAGDATTTGNAGDDVRVKAQMNGEKDLKNGKEEKIKDEVTDEILVPEFHSIALQITSEERAEKLAGLVRLKKDLLKLDKAIDKHKYRSLVPFFDDIIKMLLDEDRFSGAEKEVERVREQALTSMPHAAKRSCYTGQPVREPLVVSTERHWAGQANLSTAQTSSNYLQQMLPYLDDCAMEDTSHGIHPVHQQRDAPAGWRRKSASKNMMQSARGGFGRGGGKSGGQDAGHQISGSELLGLMSDFYAKINPIMQQDTELHSRLTDHFFNSDWRSMTITDLTAFVESSFRNSPRILQEFHDVFGKVTPRPEEADDREQAPKPQQEHAVWFCAEVRRVYGVSSPTYRGFIQAMNNYAQVDKDTLGTIKTIKGLFVEQPHLIVEFAHFVPPSFKKYCQVSAGKRKAVDAKSSGGTAAASSTTSLQVGSQAWSTRSAAVPTNLSGLATAGEGSISGTDQVGESRASRTEQADPHSAGLVLAVPHPLQRQQERRENYGNYQQMMQFTPDAKKRKGNGGALFGLAEAQSSPSLASPLSRAGAQTLATMSQQFHEQQQKEKIRKQQQQQGELLHRKQKEHLLKQQRHELLYSQQQQPVPVSLAKSATAATAHQVQMIQRLMQEPNMARIQALVASHLGQHQQQTQNQPQHQPQMQQQQHNRTSPVVTSLFGLLQPHGTQKPSPNVDLLTQHLSAPAMVPSSSASLLGGAASSLSLNAGSASSALQGHRADFDQTGQPSMASIVALPAHQYAHTLAAGTSAGAIAPNLASMLAKLHSPNSSNKLGQNPSAPDAYNVSAASPGADGGIGRIPQLDGDGSDGFHEEAIPQLDGDGGDADGEDAMRNREVSLLAASNAADVLSEPAPQKYPDAAEKMDVEDQGDRTQGDESVELHDDPHGTEQQSEARDDMKCRYCEKRFSHKPAKVQHEKGHEKHGNVAVRPLTERHSHKRVIKPKEPLGPMELTNRGAARQQREMKVLIERATENQDDTKYVMVNGKTIRQSELLVVIKEKGMQDGNIVWVQVAEALGINVKKCHTYSVKLLRLLDGTAQVGDEREKSCSDTKKKSNIKAKSEKSKGIKKRPAGMILPPANKKPKVPILINRMAQMKDLKDTGTDKDMCSIRHEEDGCYITLKLLTGPGTKDRDDLVHFLPKNTKMIPRTGGSLVGKPVLRKAAAIARRLWVQSIFESVKRSDALQERLKRIRMAKRALVEGWDMNRLGRLIEAAAVGQGLLCWKNEKLCSTNMDSERIAELGILTEEKERLIRRSLGQVHREINRDPRICSLCRIVGDSGVQGRLLYVEAHSWAHVNCICWSKGVYEVAVQKNIGRIGMLCNVHDVLSKARQSLCDFCGCPGATVQCSAQGCCSVSHFGCAVLKEWSFYSEGRVFCDCCIESPDAEAYGGVKDAWAPIHVYKLTSRHLRVMPRTKPQLLEAFVREPERPKRSSDKRKRKASSSGAPDKTSLAAGSIPSDCVQYQQLQQGGEREGDDLRLVPDQLLENAKVPPGAVQQVQGGFANNTSVDGSQHMDCTVVSPHAGVREADSSSSAGAAATGPISMTSNTNSKKQDGAYLNRNQDSTIMPMLLRSPSPWTMHVDRNSGCKYYHNHVTKESIWTKPPDLVTPEPESRVPHAKKLADTADINDRTSEVHTKTATSAVAAATGAGEGGASDKDPVCRLRAAVEKKQLDALVWKRLNAIHNLFKELEKLECIVISTATTPEDNCVLGWASLVVKDEVVFVQHLQRLMDCDDDGIWSDLKLEEVDPHDRAERIISSLLANVEVHPKSAHEKGRTGEEHSVPVLKGWKFDQGKTTVTGTGQMTVEETGSALATASGDNKEVSVQDTQTQARGFPSKIAKERARAACMAAEEAAQRQREEALNREQWDAYENNLLSNVAETMQEGSVMARIGSLTVRRLGKIKTDDDNYHSEHAIYPIGYLSNRVSFAPGDIQQKYGAPNRRAVYTCQILASEHGGPPLFQVTVENEQFYGASASEAWELATRRPLRERKKLKVHANEGQCDNVAEMFMACSYMIDGDYMFGVTVGPVARVLEALKDSTLLFNYQPRFQIWGKDFVRPNLAGCARAEPFKRRKKMSTAKTLRSAEPPAGGAAADDEPDMKNRRDLKRMYEKLRAEPRTVVQRSPIHNLGLFCTRDINQHDMVIEYMGELVRPVVGDIRDDLALEKGKSTYMFRIDDDYIVDAMFKGNASRFMNHCCEPNCYCQVVTVDGVKHIMIFARRPLEKGEEITYDYKLPIEEIKIICHCGARNCRGYMN